MDECLPKSSGKLHILSPITEPPGPILGLPGLLILQAASQNSVVSNLFVFPWHPPLSRIKKEYVHIASILMKNITFR